MCIPGSNLNISHQENETLSYIISILYPVFIDKLIFNEN